MIQMGFLNICAILNIRNVDSFKNTVSANVMPSYDVKTCFRMDTKKEIKE